jgi:hypothetical protein
LAGRIGVDDDGVSINLALQLEEGHKNLVFNLLRRPTVGRETLKLVPQGAAFFLATAFNPKGAAAPMESGAAGEALTLLDFGRELFGNLVDVAVFGLPPADGAGAGLPDVACVMRVNDTERTRALWNLVFGIAGGAPEPVELGGADVERYDIQGVPVFLAAREGRVVVSPSRLAIERAFEADRGASILDDGVFARTLEVLDHSPTLIAAACPGRCAVMARGFMPSDEARAMEPYAQLLQKTIVSLAVQHSDTRLALGARVSDIPDVSGLVTQAAKGWRQARPEDPEALRERFDLLALRLGDGVRARGLAARIVEASDDAKWLNNFAWALLTDDRYGQRFDAEALTIAERSNELSEHGNWYFLDTLALALFRAGHVEEAVEYQERALSLVDDESLRPELEKPLATYRAALRDAGQVVKGGGGGTE